MYNPGSASALRHLNLANQRREPRAPQALVLEGPVLLKGSGLILVSRAGRLDMWHWNPWTGTYSFVAYPYAPLAPPLWQPYYPAGRWVWMP